MSRVDARLREMQLLAKLDRDGPVEVSGVNDQGAERQMIISLLRDGHLNGIETLGWGKDAAMQGSWNRLGNAFESHVWEALAQLLSGNGAVKIQISHKGRVRLSELEQQLRTGRDRDETGLLWAKRHAVTDVAIALLSTSADAPLSVAFLDMNDLKLLNDTHGHDAGDQGIHTFFQAALATVGQHGEAYRYGGDEVVVVMPGVGDDLAAKLLDAFVVQLGKEPLVLGEKRVPLTASCGSASMTNPGGDVAVLVKRADTAMYRAKAASKALAPRVSAIAVGDGAPASHAPGAA